MTVVKPPSDLDRLDVVSLFSGIGGLDLGMMRAGHNMHAMCESWEPARRVLQNRFPDVPLARDVAEFCPPSPFDVLTAGFPCTDLSHAGAKAGIFGEASGLVKHAFRIAEETRPEWIVLENVPNLLLLHRGAGIAHIVSELTKLGYRWAYRTVDTRFTGLPQRRFRVLIVASLSHDPWDALFEQDVATPSPPPQPTPSGFYWTEGRQGAALVPGAIPTLKGGSPLGLPSTPAIWFPDAELGRRIVTPSVEDGEALQGFDRGWTTAALRAGEPDLRWKMIGNAVPVDVGRWVGSRLRSVGPRDLQNTRELQSGHRWPKAAWGYDKRVWTADVGTRPLAAEPLSLETLVDPTDATPLSYRATTGFLSRLDEGRRETDLFYADLEQHQQVMLPSVEEIDRKASQNPEAALLKGLLNAGVPLRRQSRPVETLNARYPIVLPGLRTAIEFRRCFWFRCPAHPTSRTLDGKRWAPKIEKNIERSATRRQLLADEGWDVHVVWEHDDIAECIRGLARASRHGHHEASDVSPKPTTVAV